MARLRSKAKKAAAGAIDTRHYDVIVAPHITEKSTLLSENNAVVFKVADERDQAGDQGGGRGAVRTSRSPASTRSTQKGKTKRWKGSPTALGRQEGDRHAWPKASRSTSPSGI